MYISRLPNQIALALIRLYQKTLSPDKWIFRWWLSGRICAHEPHCSEYGKQCFQRYPFFTALHYTMERVSTCVPRYEKKYDPSSYRVVFFSSAPIWVPFLHALATDKRFDLVGVVTMPDAPVGRGMKVQENVIKQEAKEIVDHQMCRYFFLVKSLSSNWKTVFTQQWIHWKLYEDWWIVAYGTTATHKHFVHQFQKLLLPWPWYCDTRGAYNSIIFKDCTFDIRAWEEVKAKNYWRTIGIPEDQLDWSTQSNEKIYAETITTPRSLRLDSKKYAADAQEFQQWVSDLKPDLFVVIAYGHIMPQWVLDIPTFWSINVHGSLLPEYRGASPLQSVFLDGKTQTGITVMKMDAWVDTGGMIQKLTTPLPLHRTVIDLIDWIKKQWPTFLNRVLRDWCKWLLDMQGQDEQKATLCRKFEKEDGLIDPFHDSIDNIRKKWQAFALWPKLYFFLDGKRISIDWLTLEDDTTSNNLNDKPLFANNLLNPQIKSIRLIPEGKKSLSREEFLNGYCKFNLSSGLSIKELRK